MRQQNLFISKKPANNIVNEIPATQSSWRSTPLEMLEPLSDGWFNAIASMLVTDWNMKEANFRRFEEDAKHIIDHKAWEHFPRGNPAGSPNKLLAMILDMELAEFEAQYKSRMIETARAMGPKNENGGERWEMNRAPNGTLIPKNEPQCYNYNTEVIANDPRGSDGIYLIQRALRDCPEKVDELEQGKYPSVHAMAVAAGILKKRHQVSWLDVDGLAKSLRKKLTEEERTELIQKLL